MKIALLSTLFVLGSVVSTHTVMNPKAFANSGAGLESLKPASSKSLLQKALLASKGVGAGVAGAFFFAKCVVSGNDDLKQVLNPKLSALARAGCASMLVFALIMGAEMTDTCLRSFQDLA